MNDPLLKNEPAFDGDPSLDEALEIITKQQKYIEELITENNKLNKMIDHFYGEYENDQV